MEYKLQIGISEHFVKAVKDLLKKYDLMDAPILVSEDATALEIRLTVQPRQGDGYIQVFGLCGGTYKVSSTIPTTANAKFTPCVISV